MGKWVPLASTAIVPGGMEFWCLAGGLGKVGYAVGGGPLTTEMRMRQALTLALLIGCGQPERKISNLEYTVDGGTPVVYGTITHVRGFLGDSRAQVLFETPDGTEIELVDEPIGHNISAKGESANFELFTFATGDVCATFWAGWTQHDPKPKDLGCVNLPRF